jgi:hypothetical protein
MRDHLHLFLRFQPGSRNDRRYRTRRAHTPPRIGECGAVDVELGARQARFCPQGPARIWGLLDHCFDGDVCVD